MTQQKTELKEIDLLELFRLIGSGIKNFFLWILRTMVFLIAFGIKKIYFIVLAAIFGGLIGLLLFYASQRYYSSNLTAQPNGVSATDMVQYINDLSKFCENSNTTALSYALNLPESTAMKIKNIQAYRYIDVNKDYKGDIVDFSESFNAKDTSQKIDERKLFLQVEVYDNKAFNNVKEGLSSYISKNQYFSQLNNLRKNELSELIAQIEKEIIKLDSLQNVDYFKNNSSLSASKDNNLMFLSEKDKQMYYKDKINLVKQKQLFIKELELATTPLTIIKDFAQLTIEENTKGSYIIKFSGLAFFLSFIVLIVFHYRKRLEFLIES